MKIEKNIPFPIRGKTGVTETLRKMEAGDSFVTEKRLLGGIRSTARYAGIEIVCKSISASEARVWRIK